MKKIKIYIATHKKTIFPKKEGYFPIQVGAILHDDLGYIKDSSGDNISSKNPNYCELTALYYLWKNEDNLDIIGLTHYRRYFFCSMFSNNIRNIINLKKINKFMKHYDIILPRPIYIHPSNIYNQYKKYHYIKDFETCGKIIKKYHKDYFEAYKKVIKSNKLYAYNMFIMNKELFDEYMEWLFDILFKLEKKVNISDYDDYNKRIYGFLSERLFNVWIEKKDLRIKELYVYNTEEKLFKQIKSNIRYIIAKLFRKIS